MKRIKFKYYWLKSKLENTLDKVIVALDRDRTSTLWLFDEPHITTMNEAAECAAEDFKRAGMLLGKAILAKKARCKVAFEEFYKVLADHPSLLSPERDIRGKALDEIMGLLEGKGGEEDDD